MSAPVLAEVPALQALRLFDTIPPDHIAHAVTDHGCEPLIEPGEVAVITDQRSLYPEEGGWYLIEYTNGTSYFSGRQIYVREIVTVREVKEFWWTQSPSRKHRWESLTLSDGPYDLNHLTDKILGRVVGIYRPGSHAAEGETFAN